MNCFKMEIKDAPDFGTHSSKSTEYSNGIVMVIGIRSQAFRVKRVRERQRKVCMEHKKIEMNTFELWCIEHYT